MNPSNDNHHVARHYLEFLQYLCNVLNHKGSISFTDLGNSNIYPSGNPTPQFLQMIKQLLSDGDIRLKHILHALPDAYELIDHRVYFRHKKYPHSLAYVLACGYIEAIKFLNEKIDLKGSISFADAGNKNQRSRYSISNPLRVYIDATKTSIKDFISLLPPCYSVEHERISYTQFVVREQTPELSVFPVIRVRITVEVEPVINLVRVEDKTVVEVKPTVHFDY